MRRCMLLGNTTEGLSVTPFTHKEWTQKHSSFVSHMACKFAPFHGLLQVPAHDFLSRLHPAFLKRKTKHCRCCDSDNSMSNKPHHAASLHYERNGQPAKQEVELENKGLLQQMREVFMFAGPVLGIWLAEPTMSLIDTAVVGNSSSLELAALGPGTVFCDQVGYLFMFLSVATSNLIATSMARQEKDKAVDHLSRLLFVSLVCGICLLILTGAFSSILLKGFVGPQNEALLPAACSYVQIRGLAWPAVLVGRVAQSASLGLQDAWGPLKALVIGSFLNLFGNILLCTCLGYGITGVAWATMISEWVAGFFMLRSLSLEGYKPLVLKIPSLEELSFIFKLAAPILLTIFSKVMVGLYMACSVAAEPLSQTAQAFMPALIQGSRRNVKKAQMLLRSLVVIGAVSGIMLGALGICFPWFFPQIFTHDAAVIMQMREVTSSFLWSVVVTGPLLSLEGTLLACREFKFLSLSMVACFFAGSSLLMVCKRAELGIQGIWWTIAFFQSIRLCAALSRLTSKNSAICDSQKDESASLHWKPS